MKQTLWVSTILAGMLAFSAAQAQYPSLSTVPDKKPTPLSAPMKPALEAKLENDLGEAQWMQKEPQKKPPVTIAELPKSTPEGAQELGRISDRMVLPTKPAVPVTAKKEKVPTLRELAVKEKLVSPTATLKPEKPIETVLAKPKTDPVQPLPSMFAKSSEPSVTSSAVKQYKATTVEIKPSATQQPATNLLASPKTQPETPTITTQENLTQAVHTLPSEALGVVTPKPRKTLPLTRQAQPNLLQKKPVSLADIAQASKPNTPATPKVLSRADGYKTKTSVPTASANKPTSINQPPVQIEQARLKPVETRTTLLPTEIVQAQRTTPAAPAPAQDPFFALREQHRTARTQAAANATELNNMAPALGVSMESPQGKMDDDRGFYFKPVDVTPVQNEQQMANLNSQQNFAGQAVKAATIFFGHGSRSLDNKDRNILRKVADLVQNKPTRVRVIGHASGRVEGMSEEKSQRINYKTSLDRAESVARALEKQGLSKDVILVQAKGDAEMLYAEGTKEGEAWNRRVEIFVEF